MKANKQEYVIADASEFRSGTHRVIEIGKRKIGIFNVNGKFYGLPNLCPHQLGPLCTGKVSGTLGANQESNYRLEWIMEGDVITCPWHGLEYHIPTGQCLAYKEIRLRTYEVWVDSGLVKIRL